MINTFVSIAGPFLGWCIAAALLFIVAFPLLIGLLMAFNLLRYREWLAILAVTWSMAILAGSGNYIYNLINWTFKPISTGDEHRLVRFYLSDSAVSVYSGSHALPASMVMGFGNTLSYIAFPYLFSERFCDKKGARCGGVSSSRAAAEPSDRNEPGAVVA